jgi:hypothetical protein
LKNEGYKKKEEEKEQKKNKKSNRRKRQENRHADKNKDKNTGREEDLSTLTFPRILVFRPFIVRRVEKTKYKAEKVGEIRGGGGRHPFGLF